jgi:hypothetical protein
MPDKRLHTPILIIDMKQSTTFLIATIILATLVPACKKNNKDTPPQEKPYRIKKIIDDPEQKVFSYDNKNRVTRIDFNGGSFRFIYSNAEITAQTWFSNDTPDPNWKYIFQLEGGHITSGRRYLSNGGIGREYQYGYDNQQRLATLVMSLKDFTGAEDENHRYQFLYDAQNILQQVILVRKIKVVNTLTNSDSTSATLTYFSDRSFITWKQLGFDLFGIATAGIEMQGFETMPFSFTFPERIVPAGKAIKLIDTKKYKWDGSTWSPASTNSQTFSDADYQHDATGLLQKYKSNTIQWEPY